MSTTRRVLIVLAVITLAFVLSFAFSAGSNGVSAHEHGHDHAHGGHDHGNDEMPMDGDMDEMGDFADDGAEFDGAEFDGSDDGGDFDDSDHADDELVHPSAQDGDYAVELEEGTDPEVAAKAAGCTNLVGPQTFLSLDLSN